MTIGKIKGSTLLITCGMMLLMAVGFILFADSASAHGYIESPKSRAYLCKQGENINCGPVQYEPQSVEGPGTFPKFGPPDGQIAGAGVFPDLDVQKVDRWKRVNLKGGKNTFQWHLTAPHRTTEWKYYITKKNWDPNKPLSRDALELEPFCYINDAGKKPSTTVTHECNVPTDRSGYHLILGVWEIDDTQNAFYQVIDVNLNNGDSGNGGTKDPDNGDTEDPDNGGTEEPSKGSEWKAQVSYQVGDQVTYQGKTYQCRQSHTSQTGWEPPKVPALWKEEKKVQSHEAEQERSFWEKLTSYFGWE